MKQVTFIINGMHGDHCVHVINKILSNQQGVQVLTVEQGKAEVEIDESVITKDNVIASIEKMGYKVVR